MPQTSWWLQALPLFCLLIITIKPTLIRHDNSIDESGIVVSLFKDLQANFKNLQFLINSWWWREKLYLSIRNIQVFFKMLQDGFNHVKQLNDYSSTVFIDKSFFSVFFDILVVISNVNIIKFPKKKLLVFIGQAASSLFSWNLSFKIIFSRKKKILLLLMKFPS